MFCIFNWSLAVYVWFVIKETKGKSLEDMEVCKCPQRGDRDDRKSEVGADDFLFSVFAPKTVVDDEAVGKDSSHRIEVERKSSSDGKH